MDDTPMGSAMDKALRTPEIVDLIFRHLRFTDEPSGQETRIPVPSYLPSFQTKWRVKNRALLNVALSCRMFFQPAMANLWWRVNGIMPFLKLLPNVSSKTTGSAPRHVYHGGGKISREWTLDEELDEASLDRFDFYAKLVTHILDLSRKGEDNISTLLIQLAEIRPAGKCFPKLRSFQALEYNPEPWLFYTSPSLLELRIPSTSWNPDLSKLKAMCGMLGRLPTRSQDLRVLQIPYIPNDRALGALARLSELREVKLEGSVPGQSVEFAKLLEALGALKNLRTLGVYCPKTASGSQADFETPAANLVLSPPATPEGEEWYPQLTSLSLIGTPLHTRTVLQYFSTKDLEALDLRFMVPPNHYHGHQPDATAALTAEVTLVMQEIQQHFAESLRVLRVGFNAKDLISAAGPTNFLSATLDPGALSPVFGLNHLEVFEVDSTIVVPKMEDAFLEGVKGSLGRLRVLGLPRAGLVQPSMAVSRSERGSAAKVTFGAVRQLVKELKNLEELSVEFVGGDSTEGMVRDPPTGESLLRVLDVRLSPIQDKRRMAVNIARAFPGLESLRYKTDFTSTSVMRRYTDMWKEVQAWLPVLTGRYNPAMVDDDVLGTSLSRHGASMTAQQQFAELSSMLMHHNGAGGGGAGPAHLPGAPGVIDLTVDEEDDFDDEDSMDEMDYF